MCMSVQVIKCYQHVLHISSKRWSPPKPRFESAVAWPGDGGSAPPDPGCRRPKQNILNLFKCNTYITYYYNKLHIWQACWITLRIPSCTLLESFGNLCLWSCPDGSQWRKFSVPMPSAGHGAEFDSRATWRPPLRRWNSPSRPPKWPHRNFKTCRILKTAIWGTFCWSPSEEASQLCKKHFGTNSLSE